LVALRGHVGRGTTSTRYEKRPNGKLSHKRVEEREEKRSKRN